MKKVIFAIFAHPDDEAFGPSPTLLSEVLNGNEVHLITLTLGQAGMNPDNVGDLASLRRREWHAAGKLIGAKSMHELGYDDGCLCNMKMIDAAEKIQNIVTTQTKNSSAIEIEFMTNDLNGITGHIDHIVAGRAACLAFYRLKQHDNRITRIRFACVPKQQFPDVNTEWLFMEAGRTTDEIDEIVDAREHREKIIEIMRCHDSQRSDLEYHLNTRGEQIGLNYFIVKS